MVRRFGPLPQERAVYLLQQVCHSLAEAHAHGLVHRDIKPANVYVCRHGRELDFVKVLDFGLVKSNHDGPQPDQQLTAEHNVGGTAAFMAPEQVLSGSLDGRADIYAVGCLAYWLVTGELVFSGRTPIEVMVQHTGMKPVPPSRRTEVPISDALDRLILECLEKDPAHRPATADDLGARLATTGRADA